MMVGGSRLRRAGWAVVFAAVVTLFLALTFQVRTVKSEVVRTERQIVALERETSRLETEFETRSNQRQLSEWNAVDFGYESPRADQYLENERQLASLGSLPGPGAPSPIRVARAIDEGDLPAMVNPLTGRTPLSADDADLPEEGDDGDTGRRSLAGETAGSLGERLAASVSFQTRAEIVR